jgi:hypothetical protein
MDETPEMRISRLVSEGRMPEAAVSGALEFWQDRWRDGTPLPNGELVFVRLADLYHLIVDARIWRQPQRIESALTSLFEIRVAGQSRRLGLSAWRESEGERWAMVIIDWDQSVRALHLIDERRIRRYQRTHGEVTWKSSR